METVRLVARMACVYDGRQMQIGQRFAATAEDAQLLTLLKLCDFADPPTVEEVTAEPIEASPPKRRYRRRDLEAEP